MKKCLAAITGAFHSDGGIAAVNRLVIRAMTELGFAPDIFVLTENDSAWDERYTPGLEARNIYRTFKGNKYAFTTSVWRSVLKNTYDYIIVDHVNLASILAPLSKLNRCRYSVWLCGVEVFPPNPDWEGRIGMTHAWKRLAISGFTKESVSSRFPNLPITVCDLCLDPVRHAEELPALPLVNHPEVFLPAINGEPYPLNSRVILHVGRMVSGERYKGQDCLIRAFPAIYRAFPEAQLVLAGQGDDLLHLRALAETYPAALQRNIFMPGYVTDEVLDRLYQACYLFAMPSTGEGFGLVYLEAMSRAKPCLGGRVDATPFVVRDEITGLLVDNPKSPEQVAEKIIWFLSNPEASQAMGLTGYELVRSTYLFAHFKERFWEAITE